ncbi:S41 family peptidase [Nonomuraea sp. NPDC047897]|uniref:S41 family peptidase n=1 Tax=Nonomuraea sp. NPDC047897 TaxID=3364346 RepID=UPI0037155673
MSRADAARALATVWGAVRHFHPGVFGREAAWDEALAETLRKHWAGGAALDGRAAIEHLLGLLDDPCTAVVSEPGSRDVTDPERPPALRRLDDGTCVLATAEFRKVPPGGELFSVLHGMISEGLRAPRLVIDLRGTTRLFQFSALPYLLGHFIGEETPLAMTRSRQSLGLRPEAGENITEHRDGLLTAVGGSLRPQPGPPSDIPLALVVGDANEPGYAHALALRQAGRARLVHAAGPAAQAPGTVLALPEGTRVRVRTHEYVGLDGGPDLLADPADGISAAVRTLMSAPPAPSALPTWGLPPGPAAPDTAFPEREYRLLGLMKLWCAARWFFPYHELCDRPWDEAFAAALPLFEEARDERDYARATGVLTTWLHDSHAQVMSPAWLESLGGPTGIDAMVRLVEGRTVVVQSSQPELAVGDVVTVVDGTPCAERRAFLGRYLSASTPQALENAVDSLLLTGPAESTATLVIERAGQAPSTVVIPRTPPKQLTYRSHLPVFGELTEGVGYIDLVRLAASQAEQAFEEVERLPGLVIDLRGYPGNAGPQLASRLTGRRVPYARHAYPAPDSPGHTSDVVRDRLFHIEPADPGRSYEGRVAVLVDESTISQGEVVCLMILGAAQGRARVFGTATSGAVGNVTDVRLPGQSVVMFSGFSVRHPDGGTVQRKGIVPDTVVPLTLSAVRAGRDETLQAAMAHLRPSPEDPLRPMPA